MKKIALTVLTVLICLFLLVVIAETTKEQTGNLTGTDLSLQSTNLVGQNIPVATGYVNDNAMILDEGTKAYLETRLTEYANGKSGEIAVLTIPSLNGLTIEEYGIRLAEAWKVGKYGQDNGEILIIAVQERKVRIETGSASVITDAQAAQILAQSVVPYLKNNNWNEGVKAGVEALISATTKK